MQTNNQFSIKRFILLAKHSLIVNKKNIGIAVAGISGTMFLLLLLFQKMGHFNNWSNNAYFGTFMFFFFSLGAIYASTSFPAFRSKEKSISYLNLPASISEKYIFELLIRVVGYIILLPTLFWLIANAEGRIIHYYIPDFANYKFSFSQVLVDNPMTGWSIIVFIQCSLFVFIAAFTGACHFSKSPLIKTLFTFSIIALGYFLFIYLLIKGFDIENYRTLNNKMLFFKSEKGSIAFFGIASTVVNLTLLVIAWFRLKEKEV